MRDSKRAMRSIKTVRWTVLVPGCVPASAEARRANSPSAPKRNSHFCGCFFFYIMRDSKRAMRSIKTVRRTVLVPGCVPTSAETRRANSPSASSKFRIKSLGSILNWIFDYNFLLIFFLQIDDLLKIEYNILKEGML